MYRTVSVLLGCALCACGSEASAPASPGATSTPAVSASAAAGSMAVAPVAAAAPAASNVATQPTAAAAPAVATPVSPMQPAAAPAQAQPPANTSAADAPAAPKKLAMDECGLKTQYKGDEYCILPPPADKGFQLHIGPSSYDNPEAKYILQPGEENVVNMTATSGNDKDIYYFYRQYRMRPGSHHVIVNVDGRRIGGIQNLARDAPDNGVIAPEDQGVGLPLKAHSQMNINMHWYNFGDKPTIRELWVNYWYKDAASVKEPTHPVYSMTGVTAATAHSHVIVGATCPVTGTGRILDLYGHRHLNNKRFSVWRNSGGKRDLVFDDYDAEHPGSLDYNSLAMNPAPNPMAKTLGGVSGMLEVKQGDTLEFECEIVNDTDKNFFGANEAEDDEMCIMIGDSVGAQVSAMCATKPAQHVN